MKKRLRKSVIILCIGSILTLGGFLGLTLYYRNNFPVNTWINGIYCTGKSIEQVNQELSDQTEVPAITIVGMDGSNWQLDLHRADGRADYTAALMQYLHKNSIFFWMNYLQEPISEQMTANSYVCDREALWTDFNQLEIISEAKKEDPGVRLNYTDQGYELRDGNIDRLDVDRAFVYLEECLEQGQCYVDLSAGECYETLEDSASDMRVRQIWDRIQEFTECQIVYDMGAESIPLTPDITCGFLKVGADALPVLDASGKLMIDEESVRAWVEELAQTYNTVDTELEFHSTRGDVVNVKYETYGTELDVESEITYLTEVLSSSGKITESHIPAYLSQGYVRGLDDIGGTYIEVDMTEQHMYYYVDGELVFDTDVVTGHTGLRRGTPQGVNFVYAKQRNRILRGPDYASPVKYWMPVRGSVGIHDADWRSRFGGQIYKTDGSHGCINTPPKKMAELYEMVEIGTPVITFY